MAEKIIRIDDKEILDDNGELLGVVDLIIENAQGRWYGVDLGNGDWDYLSDNGEYVAVAE